ncbi:MAG TPA: NAD(P)H-dependent oxidoreductase [Amaricoccus sp.]|nr:NAD(P)H-dependent oxidoreductase [Amaricoccus sp.]
MPRSILVLYAHPAQHRSEAHQLMARVASGVEGVTFADLYAEYPRFEIDIDREQARLAAHDVLIFQCPVYWYSTPALLKEWQDLVLEYGWAYGTGGTALSGKLFLAAVTAGGPVEAYAPTGYQRFPLRTLLSPLEQTAWLCGMTYLPPFVLFAAHRASQGAALALHAARYRRLLEALRDDRLDPARHLEQPLLEIAG